MINTIEPYHWDDHRKILTPNETGIPALRVFGIYSNKRAGQPLRTHIHEDCIEITFLLKGFQIYEVENTHFNLTGSNIFVAYPNEPHSTGDYPESISNLIWMQINLREDIPFFGLDTETANYLRQALRTLPRLFGGDSDLQSILTSAFFSLASSDSLAHFAGQQQLVYALFRIKQLSRQVTPLKVDSIGNAISYIHDNLDIPIELEDAAICCGLSLSRFKTKFKEETGTTPREYINHVKIEHSKRLLEAGKPVTEIALSLGFTTSNYFSVLFKKYTGKTPSEYRNSFLDQG